MPNAERRSGPTHGWTLYVIGLKKSVLRNKRFHRANPEYLKGKPCVYVGVTFRSAQERFEQHMAGKKSSKLVKKYGKHVREKECRHLRPMGRKRAEKKESSYAARLRKKGYAVWSK